MQHPHFMVALLCTLLRTQTVGKLQQSSFLFSQKTKRLLTLFFIFMLLFPFSSHLSFFSQPFMLFSAIDKMVITPSVIFFNHASSFKHLLLYSLVPSLFFFYVVIICFSLMFILPFLLFLPLIVWELMRNWYQGNNSPHSRSKYKIYYCLHATVSLEFYYIIPIFFCKF